jgi:hypothetical protein
MDLGPAGCILLDLLDLLDVCPEPGLHVVLLLLVLRLAVSAALPPLLLLFLVAAVFMHLADPCRLQG